MLKRRHFLLGVLAAACGPRRGGGGGSGRGPAQRPRPSHGVQVGDPQPGGATVWCRADAPGRMVVEWAAEAGSGWERAQRVVGPVVGVETDLCGVVDLTGLPAGERVRYRVWFEAPGGGGAGDAVEGALWTPGAGAGREASFVWSGDVAGQGWGIDRDWGGYRIFDVMRRREPPLFVSCGDLVYADGPLAAEVPLGDGRVWRNLVTPAKSRVASSLDDFRGNFAYNLLDEPLRRFLAETPIAATWDDHEVTNNWWPGERLEDGRLVDAMAALAKRAMFEWLPFGGEARTGRKLTRRLSLGPQCDLFMLDARSFKGPNGPNLELPGASPGPRGMFGDGQIGWLERELLASRALWKVVVSSTPWTLIVPDGEVAQEGVGQWDDGPPRGRELELAELLERLEAGGLRNLLVVTADVHYAAAIECDPARRSDGRRAPRFWELVAGPLHAGLFGPNKVDASLGAELRFERAPTREQMGGGPAAGLQSFGAVRVDGKSGVLRASLHDGDGSELWSVELAPEGAGER